MKRGRTDDGDEVYPKWLGLHPSPTTEWIDHDLYQKAYFKAPSPSITTSSAIHLKIIKDGDHFRFIIKMNDEIKNFINSIERDVFFAPFAYSLEQQYKILLPSYDGNLYIKSLYPPTVFNEQKEQVSLKDMPLLNKAKVKIIAQCISRKKGEHVYHVFLKIEQILIDNSIECAW